MPDKDASLLSRNDAIYIYAGILVLCIILNLLTNNLIIRMCMKASVRLHRTMFENLVHATMSFFNKNPSGKHLDFSIPYRDVPNRFYYTRPDIEPVLEGHRSSGREAVEDADRNGPDLLFDDGHSRAGVHVGPHNARTNHRNSPAVLRGPKDLHGYGPADQEIRDLG